MERAPFSIRAITPADRAWIPAFARERWGAEVVIGHGVVYRFAELAGFVAEAGAEVVGMATYLIESDACELVSIDSLRPNQGVGAALLAAVATAARAAGCRRVWLITTNDNLRALGFYQRRGYRLVAVHRDAVTQARALKPTIPLQSADGIPIRDEIELELPLD